MTTAGFDTDLIAAHLAAGARVLTANNRLTRTLLEAWGHRQQTHCQVWEIPAIGSLDHWLEGCWQQLLQKNYPATLNGALITSQQEHLLWQQVIREASPLSPTSLAQHAQQAYRIIQHWHIDQSQLDNPLPEWISGFRQRLQELSMITEAERNAILLQAFSEQKLARQTELILLGFQSLSPQQQDLLQAAARKVIHLQLPSRNQQHHRVALNDLSSEVSAAAHWSKQQLEQQPQLRIGVVVPQLGTTWRQVERIFRNCFEVNQWAPKQFDTAPQHYNISAGTPLTETPIVASAFELLALNQPHLPLEHFRKLLYSPFWGTDDSLQTRADTDRMLSEQGSPTPSPGDLRFHLNRAEATIDAPVLSPKLTATASLQREAPSAARLSTWVKLFSEQLQLLGWPGHRVLSSSEYQQLQHWQQLIERMPEYDDILGDLSITEACNQLQQLAGKVVFQAESPPSGLQILGLLESAAIQFDKLWLIGVDDTQWPSPTRLNPLLPVALQQRLATPKASPEQELRIAETYLRDLTASATEIVFSHSLKDGDRELQPSGLISHVPARALEELLSGGNVPYPFQPAQFIQLESFDDSYGPSLAEASETPTGGTAIFSDQARCPFNSFVRHRLGAKTPPEPSLGLSPIDRGTIIHSVLEQLWTHLENQQQLLQLSQDDLVALLEKIIRNVLQPWRKKRKALFGPRFYRVESQRLKQLLLRWIVLEKQRQPFRVQALEQQLDTNFAGIPLQLRIDRIDASSNGHLILMDYKTGAAGINAWLGERPDQPQLPLYALNCPAPLAAVCFALLNASQCEFRGIGESNSLLPRLKTFSEQGFPDAETLMQQWREALTCLADEFKTGYAAVSFSKPTDALRQAELLPLNRWYQYLEDNNR